MEQLNFTFPDRIQPFVVEDSVFAKAYEETLPLQRSWLKTNIARLFDWYSAYKVQSCDCTQRWQSDFVSRSRTQCVDFAVILFDDSMLSPARLMAALMPAITCGVQSILVVRVADQVSCPQSILTALELAGQELFVEMTDSQAKRLLKEVCESQAYGIVTALGKSAAALISTDLQTNSRIATWRSRFSRTASVWLSEQNSFNLEKMAFIHPDLFFDVFGTEREMPSAAFSYKGSQFTDFLNSIQDVAYVSDAPMADVLARAKLVLGPGHEAEWLWSDLHTSFLQRHSTAWLIGD